MMRNKAGKIILTAFICLLSACASIPLMSLPKLMSLDIETIDLSKVEMAVRVQDNVGLVKGSATVKVEIENKTLNKTLTHALIAETPDASLTPYLIRQAKPGYTVRRFKLTPEQAIDAQIFREKALVLKSKGEKDLKTSLSAFVRFCEYKDTEPYDQVSMTFYIRTNPKKDFYKLFKEQHIKFDQATQEAMAKSPKYCE